MGLESTRIEDAKLACPWCGYNLTALTSNRCPECGKYFALCKPGVAMAPQSGTIVSRSMMCPECGFCDERFMPRACGNCGRSFTLRQRIFGTSGLRIG